MKKLYVIFFTFLIMVSMVATDRYGGRPSWANGHATGTSIEAAKSVGINPYGGVLWLYDSVLLKTIEPGRREGMAVSQIDTGTNTFLVDEAQCEDDYMPVIGNTVIYMYGKQEKDVNGIMRGYYGSMTFKKGIISEDPENPEYVNDIYIYEIPTPHVNTDGKNCFVSWSRPLLQEIGNMDGNPILGYNLYFTAAQGEPGTKVNGAPISYAEPAFLDIPENGYYYITLVMRNGAELGNYDFGPDKAPGYKDVDDNGNGKVDEYEEIGFGDDVPMPIRSVYSNYSKPNEPFPPISDLSIVNSDKKIYLQWSASPDPTCEKYFIYKNGIRLYETINTIWVDTKAASGDKYEITVYNAGQFESAPSNPVTAEPYDGTMDQKDFSLGETVLFPAWSKGVPAWATTQCTSFFCYDKATDKYSLNYADLKGNNGWLFNARQVYWASSVSWGDYKGHGPDSCIYFTAIDAKNHTQIYVQNSDPTKQNDYAQISQGWGNWVDPDWTDSLNQWTTTNMLACSIDGDIWVLNPDDSNINPGENLIALTDFVNPDDYTYGKTDMCYEPKWSPDNTAMAFIIRHPALPVEVAVSDIYIIPDVQNLIGKIYGGNNPITSLNDTRLEIVTETHSPARYKPIWCPSWSNDSTMVSYNVDVSNKFANYIFSSKYSDAVEILGLTNFDVYTYERGIGTWPVGYPEKNTSNNEGFVSWAPAGGDKFSEVYINTSTIEINQFIDPTIYGVGGKASKMAKRNETATTLTISDRDFTSITVNKDHYNQFENIAIYPIEREPENYPFAKKNIAAMRRFMLGGTTELDYTVTLKIHYTRFQAKGNYEENNIVPYRYNEDNQSWERIYSYALITDEDGNPFNDDKDGGFVEITTKTLGLIGLFNNGHENDGDDDDDDDEELSNVVVGPNPSNGDLVTFRNIPKETKIKIYSIFGELVASSKSANSLRWVTNKWEWIVKNDDNLKVASGIYIVTFEYNGKTTKKKVAIVR